MTLLAYATDTDIYNLMPDTAWVSSDYATTLQTFCLAASRAIDRYCKRIPGSFSPDTDTVMYYAGSGCAILWTDEMVASPTSVYVSEVGSLTSSDYTLWASSDYIMLPVNAPALSEPYRGLQLDTINGGHWYFPTYPNCVKITAKFGFSATPPEEIKYATCAQALRFYKRYQQGMADTGTIPEISQLAYTKRIDPEIAEILDSFVRTII